MTIQLSDLIAQRAAIDQQIKDAQKAAKGAAVARVRELMERHGLQMADLAEPHKKKAGAKSGMKVAPKYRDPVSGATWSGRGLKPKWLVLAIKNGKEPDDFAV